MLLQFHFVFHCACITVFVKSVLYFSKILHLMKHHLLMHMQLKIM